MIISSEDLIQLARRKEDGNKKLFKQLRRLNPGTLDVVVKELHEKVFENINCMECANCCKSISPIITDKDIVRISKLLRMRPASFTQKYLHIDNDGDYVFNDLPCPFLMPDNICSIYSFRPKACSGYPHTDRKHFIQILDLTLRNTFICPAAFEVVEKLKAKYI